MATTPYVRFREVTLLTRDMNASRQLLSQLFDLSVSNASRSEVLGVEFAMLPVGTGFIELVAPLRPDAGPAKALERTQGRGGFMAFFDCEDLDIARARVDALGVRVVHVVDKPPFKALQLHPRDCGVAMVELLHNDGGDELTGHYGPAGPNWRDHVRSQLCSELLGLDLTCQDPQAIARRWGDILGRAPTTAADGQPELRLDHGDLRLLPGQPGDEDRIDAVRLACGNTAEVLTRARALGCETRADAVLACGVWFKLIAA